MAGLQNSPGRNQPIERQSRIDPKTRTTKDIETTKITIGSGSTTEPFLKRLSTNLSTCPEVEKITQNSHFNNQANTRVTCDASREGLGAVIEQFLGGEWRPIVFASRF